ncbi:MAG: LytTR family DNA-binding domain-containing protein, partial [Candidatus Subteraquimicrobiales bacterium]|nr:LytTR family DNA-binding domain-containing protein [Candidatus Subteraquimicrobiales bacterium]
DISNPPFVVFVTAYSEYAAKAFELDAVDYLLKPVDLDRLNKTIERIIARKAKRAQVSPKASLNRIPVQRNDKLILIDIKDIYYVSIKSDLVYIHTFDDTFACNSTLRELEARLGNSFFRTHRAFLVNLNQVAEIVPMFGGTYILKFKDARKSEIPVSRRSGKKLKEILGM